MNAKWTYVGTDNRVFIWRRWVKNGCHVISKHPTPKFSLMIWGCITFNGIHGIETVTVVDANINARTYIEEQLWPVI